MGRPAEPDALDLKVSALTDQAIVFRHFGRLDAAREYCRKALDIAAALISRDPSIARAMGDLEKARHLARELGVTDPSTAAGEGGRRHDNGLRDHAPSLAGFEKGTGPRWTPLSRWSTTNCIGWPPTKSTGPLGT